MAVGRNRDERMSTRRETPQHETYEALRAEIARRHPRFSDRLQVIAEFALDHPTEIALGTVAEVAQRARVQPSAIVRFARAMGYGGFTEMQQVFRSRLIASVAPSYKERISGLRRDGRFQDTKSPRAVLSRFAAEGRVALESPGQPAREGFDSRDCTLGCRADHLCAGTRRLVSCGRAHYLRAAQAWPTGSDPGRARQCAR